MPLSINPTLASLPVYQPGRPIEEVARELGLDVSSIIKLASNENPSGPSPKSVEAMRRAATQQHLYPDGNAFHLKNRLAEKLGVASGNLIVGNGSNEIIEFVGHALMRPGKNIVVSEFCFAIYPIVAHMCGADVVTVPARDFGHDLKAMAAAIGPDTTAVFVANPNNPTGTLASEEDVRALVAAVPENVLLVMDEAYFEFLDEPVDLIPEILGGRSNLLIMRTFSKIYGLAGLRVGYGVGPKELIASLERVRQPFNLNGMAQVAALAALHDDDHLEKTRRINHDGLTYFSEAFSAMGLEWVPSHGNFVLVKVGDGAKWFAALQKQGVIVRPMAGYKLPEWIRVSVGVQRENEKCVAAMKAVLADT